jgi:drug/metabolite transporter (DMT)-like permease
MKLHNNFKGYITAFISTITLANVYIFSKAALNEINFYQFGFYWFGFAIVWNLIYSLLRGHFKNIKKLNLYQIKHLGGIGIIEVIATTTIFIGINIIPNPSIPALIRNLEPVLIVFLAIIFLKEKFTKFELLGVLLTIAGTIIISYNKSIDSENFLIPGVQYIIISCVFYAIRTVWSKKVITHFSALTLNLNKVVFLFITFIPLVLITKTTLSIPNSALINILIGSLIGPFMTSFLQFLSLKHIDASRSNLVMSLTGFITIILAYFYFKTLPFTYQIIGGLITVIGLGIITLKLHR